VVAFGFLALALLFGLSVSHLLVEPTLLFVKHRLLRSSQLPILRARWTPAGRAEKE
jgi:hypothetical protein